MNNQQVIFITGASSGFGLISAISLVRQGHIVYGTSRKKTINHTNGINILTMDVTDPNSIQKAIEQIISEQGRIDVLINNAGVGISGALELATEEEVKWQMDTNFFGVANVCNAVLPVMRKAGNGKIINISSLGGIIAVPFQGFYSASKFALEGYSEALSYEVLPFGIQVCLIEPGDFQTNFTANRNISSFTLSNEHYKDSFSYTMNVIEQAEKNGANPEKLAAAVCKLVRIKHPPFRTKVGPVGQVLFGHLKGSLPDKLIRYVIRKFYIMPKTSPR